MKNLRCFWYLATKIALVVVLVSIVHMVLFPLTPYDYFKLVSDSSISSSVSSSAELTNGFGKAGIDLKYEFPADLHDAHLYKGALWKAEIGRWLANCDSLTKDVNISETLHGNDCKNECNGLGVCNLELGQCRCFQGYTGDGCTDIQELECNYPRSHNHPFGKWVTSMCSANCDKTRALCFCGEGTKYPHRPLPHTCGFIINRSSETFRVNSIKVDEDVFTTNGSIPGWCNVDPIEAYEGKIKFKEECHCPYDGFMGRFCEVPVQYVCINQCSRHGQCRGGFCQCDNGWYGADCSTPSVISSIGEWPSWLRPSRVDVPDNIDFSEKLFNINVVVAKKRPLIYIYDLPPEFNSLLLEGRQYKGECVNRIYDENNATIWTKYLYGSQLAIYESLLASPHRTLNGEEADFFFVPVLDSWIISRAGFSPRLSLQKHMGLRSSLALEYYKNAYNHIVEQYPYWNRSSGRDHIWFFSWDEGACYAPKEIWNSMMLVHWGNTNTKHKHSTTAYWPDNWDIISSNRRGTHPCFDPHKDLVLPAWKLHDANVLRLKLWTRPRQKRKTLFYFNGNLGSAYLNGRPEPLYSMGIRQKLAEEFGSSPTEDGKLGKQQAEDVIVTSVSTDDYDLELGNSVFCGVFPGDGWSGRMEDSVLQGCIPVIIQDGIFLPYENVLNYDNVVVRILEEELPNMINILRGINNTQIDLMQANVQKIWQRFLYRDCVILETERQKAAFGHFDDWEIEFLKSMENDVTTTLIQVLHYKLHNDPWRKQVGYNKKFGLPNQCVVNTN